MRAGLYRDCAAAPVDPFQPTLTADVGRQDSREGEVRQGGEVLFDLQTRRLGPPLSENHTVSRIEGENYAAGVATRESCEPIRLVERACAHDDPVHASFEESICHLVGSDPSSDLDTRIDRRGDLVHKRRVTSTPEGGVEIDDVQALESGSVPASGHRNRIRKRHTLDFWPPADELNAAPPSEVHRWQGDHEAAARMKFVMIWRPSVELFSGWNCTPQVFATRTPAAKRSPS